MILLTLTVLALSGTTTATPSLQQDRVASRLRAAVDLPSPGARAEAAAALADDDSISLEEWLAAAEAFAPLECPHQAGSKSLDAQLRVLGKTEATEMWVFVPEAYDHGAPTPLIVGLHGAGGRGDNELQSWTQVATELGAVVVCPTEAGQNIGFTGEPRERRAVLEAIRWARRRWNVDENRIWLTGYSRGGILAWDIALRFPGQFAGVAPMAGGPRVGSLMEHNNLRYLDNLLGLPLRGLAGARDQPALIWSLKFAEARWQKKGIETAKLELIEGAGHGFVSVQGRKWPAWFQSATREPWPKTVVRRAARLDEAGRSWVRIEQFGLKVEDGFDPIVRTKKGVTLSQEELRARVVDLAEKRTARAEATYLGDGKIEVETELVKKTTLLIAADWIPENGRLSVRQNGRKRKKKAALNKAVLLAEFVESFDRTFLPVAKITL